MRTILSKTIEKTPHILHLRQKYSTYMTSEYLLPKSWLYVCLYVLQDHVGTNNCEQNCNFPTLHHFSTILEMHPLKSIYAGSRVSPQEGTLRVRTFFWEGNARGELTGESCLGGNYPGGIVREGIYLEPCETVPNYYRSEIQMSKTSPYSVWW